MSDKLVQAIVCSYPSDLGLGEFAAEVATISTKGALLGGESVSEWLAGPFTKTVRRARGSTLRKIEMSDDSITLQKSGLSGSQSMTVYPPMTYDSFPKVLRKAQLFKEELEVTDFLSLQARFTVVVDSSLGMSSGKTAAQVAHAVMKWHLLEEKQTVTDFSVVFLDEVLFKEQLSQEPSVVIVDNGLTEIPAETVTCFIC